MEHEVIVWLNQFSLPLVALALLVCAAGSLTVIALLGRAVTAGGGVRWLWLAVVCIGFGADVWATHFIAMLAYQPGIPFSYRAAPTVLSIMVAIMGSAMPFGAIIFRPASRPVRIIAGLALGLAAGGMHFVGMSAMRMGAPATENPGFLVAGLAAGMILSALAMDRANDLSQPRNGRLATMYLMLAICGLHFIAMGGFSVAVPPLPQAGKLAGLTEATLQHSTMQWLALTVAAVGSLILLSAFSAVAADRKFVAMRQREAANLQQFARHDELTNLPNRVHLRELLEQAIARPGEVRPFALFYIDLDRFKAINDLFGHQAGDVLLTKVAERIRGLVRESDTAARFGGDEFVILQRGTELPPQAAALADRLVRCLAEPVSVHGRSLRVGASIGIAFHPAPDVTIKDVFSNADSALHRAKADGGGCYRFFEPEMRRQVLNQRTLELDFHAAVEQKQFVLHYQPIFNCESGMLSGFEALLRWPHPTRGMIPPMDFIPFAEKSGLIVALGIWILETACAQAALWPASLRIAVNLSPVQLRRDDFDEAVLGVLARTGLPPARLELEVTENALIESPEQALNTMTSLRQHGVQFAIDDFGTGYSSLSLLRRFPFDRIKIDRSFVQGLPAETDSAVIVRTIIGLGHSLRIGVLAEGVETAEQLRLLREQNCDHIQGYLLGRPIATEAVAALIAQHFTAARAPAEALTTL